MLNFLTPDFFNALVFLVIAVGLVLAALRIRNDFRRGPRWTNQQPMTPPEPQEPVEETKHD
jgi:hypothetical protein